jgi:EF-hand domain pair/EF hand
MEHAMTRKFLLAAAGLAVFTVSAAAGGWHQGGMGLFERYDGNKDGKVTQDEIDANRAAWHGAFDKDKSGGLAIAEFEGLWLKAKREEMVREFQAFDKDGDGLVTMDEYKGPMATTVADMDKNGDGALSRENAAQ